MDIQPISTVLWSINFEFFRKIPEGTETEGIEPTANAMWIRSFTTRSYKIGLPLTEEDEMRKITEEFSVMYVS